MMRRIDNPRLQLFTQQTEHVLIKIAFHSVYSSELHIV